MKNTVALLFIAMSACAHDGAVPPAQRPTIVAEPRPAVSTLPPALPPAPPTVVALPAEPPFPAQTTAPAALTSTTRPLTIVGRRSAVTYPVVALPDAAAIDVLDRHVSAELQAIVTNNDGSVRGACTATLASATLVSVVCDLTTSGGRESSPGGIAGAATFRVAGTRVARMDPAEAFLPGTRLGDAVCVKALGHAPAGDDHDSCWEVAVALSPTAVVGRVVAVSPRNGRSTVRRVEIPYTELASLIRRDGALAWVVPATPPAESPITDLLRAATPREGGGIALGEPMSPALLADAYLRAHVAVQYSVVSAVPVDTTMLRLVVPADTSPTEVAALSAVTHGGGPVLWSVPRVRLSMARTTTEAVLRTRPTGGDIVRVLPPGTWVVLFDGTVLGTDSVAVSSPGLPTFAAAGASAAGWMSGVEVIDDDTGTEVGVAGANFEAALPAAVRTEVERDVLRVYVTAQRRSTNGERLAFVGRSASTASSYIGVYGEPRTDGTPDTWPSIFFTRVDGAAATLRVFQPAVGNDSVVAIASRVAGDPAGVERWAFYALAASTPSFTLSLRTGTDVPDAERVRVVTEDGNGLRVEQGTTTTQYEWNGTTFTPPAP